MTVHAALRLAIVVGKPAVIVCVLNDHGVRHMRKVFNPEWLHENAMITKEQKTDMVGKQLTIPKPVAAAVATPSTPSAPVAKKHSINLEQLEKENNLLLVQVTSSGFKAGNMAKIMINDKAVKMELNENSHQRGLHIAVLVKGGGQPKKARVFDTYKSSEELESFINSGDIKDGSIVVAACMDECVSSLSWEAKKWFSGMGSKEIWNLEYRQGFCFIGISGQTACFEKRAADDNVHVQLTQMFQVSKDGAGAKALAPDDIDISDMFDFTGAIQSAMTEMTPEDMNQAFSGREKIPIESVSKAEL